MDTSAYIVYFEDNSSGSAVRTFVSYFKSEKEALELLRMLQLTNNGKAHVLGNELVISNDREAVKKWVITEAAKGIELGLLYPVASAGSNY